MRKQWYLAADDDGGREFGWKDLVDMATFCTYLTYLRWLRLSFSSPPYSSTTTFSPASSISWWVLAAMKTSAIFWNSVDFLRSFTGRDLPMFIILLVVSQPLIACANSSLLHVSVPILALAVLMSHSLAFLPLGMKYTLWRLSVTWYRSKTRRSVSSPMRTVVELAATSRVVLTIRQSASSFAWWIWNPNFIKVSLRRLMKRCLLLGLARNFSRVSWRIMSPVKFTCTEVPCHLTWVAALVVCCVLYPSNTMVAFLYFRATNSAYISASWL